MNLLYCFIYLAQVFSSHIYAFEHNVTFSPADDVIHEAGHTCPEAAVPRVALLWLPGPLVALMALVKPPKLPTAEEIGLAVVGPGEGCLHPVHQHPALCPHAPVREGPRVTAHGHRVSEDPVLRSWTEESGREKISEFVCAS